MKNAKLEHIIESLRWKNPKTGAESTLGNYIGNGVIIKGHPEERKEEIALLSAKDGYEIGWGGEGEIFVYSFPDRKALAVKRYRDNIATNAWMQFRCLSKIRELGIETPNVYAASEKALVMDFLQYPMLEKIFKQAKGKEKERLNEDWARLRIHLINALPEEFIDMPPKDGINGYLKRNGESYIIGVFDQG